MSDTSSASRVTVHRPRSARRRLRLPVTTGHGRSFTVNVSKGGVCTEQMRVLPVGTRMEGHISLDGHEAPFAGKVAWAVTGDPRLNQLGQMGVRFDHVGPGFARRLDELETRLLPAAVWMNEMLSGILEALPNPVFVKDEGRRWVLLNDSYCRLLGYERTEMLGKTEHEVFPKSEADAITTRDDAVFSSSGVSETEERFTDKQGTDHVMLVRRTLHVEPDGGRFLLGLITDITERTRAERALEASETRYRRLFEAAKDGILILDAKSGKIVDVNPYLMELTGYSREDFLGLHLWEIGPFKDREESKASFADLQAREYVRHEDLPLLGRDGREIAVEFISNVYRVGEQSVIQCNIRDITARKLAEKERKGLEQQFQQSQKLEGIGRLAGGIAHDFNNLLTVILSCAETLTEEASLGPTGQAEVVDDILIAGRRAEELTRQLLAFARKQVIAPVPTDLNTVVRQSEKLLRRALGEDVELVTTLPPELWLARCDAGQIEQVILNLAINARDAMPKGGKLTIDTANVQVDDDFVKRYRFMRVGPHVRLRVVDTGAGMTPEVKAHVFEPFFTTKPPGKGTGLGLATVYGIVKQSEGYIVLESAPGHGTTFEVYFPRTTDAAVPPPVLAPTSRRGTETVLVVEDDPLVRKVALRSLTAAGYRVMLASNGQEALEIAADEKVAFDLLLTDVIMPGLNGREVADGMRRARPGLRVLYMSGYAHDIISKAGVLDSGIEVLRKPFSATRLQERVRAALDAARPASPG
jgi:two-component system cell cycle sensor histidine kinase/response regulator CckA